MNATELLADLQARHVELSYENQRLTYKAPKGALSEADLKQIRANKNSLIGLLRQTHNDRGLHALLARGRPEVLHASYAQQRLWFIDQMEGAGTVYNVAGGARLKGTLNRQALRATLDTILARHEVLRTVFSSIDGQPIQVICNDAKFALEEMDLTAWPADNREAELSRLAVEEARGRFDLKLGPLIRGRLIRIAEQQHVLLVTMHHIVSDGWSMGIFLREMASLYSAYSEGRTRSLPALPMQYADYAQWQREWLQADVQQQHAKYWREQLAGAVPPELPMDRPRPAVRSYAGAAHQFTIPRDVSNGIAELARASGATLYMALLAAYQVLLSRLCAQRDILVATPMAGRELRETETLIGFFVNMLIMRGRIDKAMSFRQFLTSVKDNALQAYTHQELPFDKLMAELQGTQGGPPIMLARVAFTLLNTALQGEPIKFSGIVLEPFERADVVAKTDLLLTMFENASGLHGNFEYATQLLDAETVQSFAQRYVRLLAEVVARPDASMDEMDATLPFVPGDALASRPLTANQEVMWIDLQVHPHRAYYYNIADYVQIFGPVDPVLFERAIQHVVNCTSALRLRFHLDANGMLRQQVPASLPITVAFHDFSAAADAEAAAEVWVEEHRRRPIDVINELPFKFALLKVSEDNFFWYKNYHHLVMDGVGVALSRGNVAQVYTALAAGQQPTLRNDAENYLQYLHLDAEYRYSARYLADADYWARNVDTSAAVTLSVSTRPAIGNMPVRAKLYKTSESVRALKAYAADLKISLGRLMVAAAGLYLHKMTGAARVSIGLPTHGRFEECARELVGACTNISPIQFDAAADMNVRSFTRGVGTALKAALEHGRYRYEDIRRLLNIRPQDPPLYNITVNVLPYLTAVDYFAGARGVTRTRPSHERDLIIWIFYALDVDDLVIVLDGNPSLYEEWEIQGHTHRLGWLIDKLVEAGADCTLRDLPAMGVEERRHVVEDFNATTSAELQEKRIHELFETQVARHADALAVSDGIQQLSYAELNERSNQLAHYLRELGVRPDELVGICVDRSVEMVVGILGILKCGAAYVPLDPGYPTERLQYMVSESAARVVLTQSKHQAVLGSVEQLVVLDAQWSEIAGSLKSNPLRVGLSDEELAYVIYTSGSTGRAKGTCVTHAGVRNLLQWYVKQFEFGAQDKVLVVSSFSFDLTQKNFFACLLSGGQLHLGGEPFDPRGISGQIEREAITTLNLTPSAFYALLEVQSEGYAQLRSLRRVFLGGEPINVQRLVGLGRAQPKIQLINSYGPTECTDVVSYHCFAAEQDSAGVPIGGPIWNTQLYVVDASLEPVPLGAVGEICIAGAGVSRGYLNRAGLTAERFVADPFSARTGQRMYRTGDLGRWRADGTIEYLGRNDHQVKVRGFRIELGEIEAQLGSHAQVKEAVVVAREEAAGEKRLVAYLVPTSEELEIESLKGYLRSRMPEYMVPSAYVVLPQLPLTPNGKVDRKALPAPESAGAGQRQYETPQGAVEERLAQIWQELLHVERIGRHDNFFELGGHSLLAVRLAARIQSAFQWDIPLRELFLSTSLRSLAEHIAAMEWGKQSLSHSEAEADERETILL